MTESRWREELAECRPEFARLRERLATVIPTVHKDLSLISLISQWSGAKTAAPLQEFLSITEGSATIGRWDGAACLQVAVLRLVDPAKRFYNAKLELHAEGTTWEKIKSAFRERFKDVRTDQYHFTKVQTVRQVRNEGPRELTNRCKALAQKVMGKLNDPVRAAYFRENAERMCLASFVAGLVGTSGRQARFSNPQITQVCLKIALTVTEAEKQEKTNEIMFMGTEGSSGRPKRAPGRKSCEHENSRQACNPSMGKQQNKRSTAQKWANV